MLAVISGKGRRSVADRRGREADRAGASIKLGVVTRVIERLRIVVERDHALDAQTRHRQRQHARAGADVKRGREITPGAFGLQRDQRATRSGMMSGAESKARVDDYRNPAVGRIRIPWRHDCQRLPNCQRFETLLPHRRPSRIDQRLRDGRRSARIEHPGSVESRAMGLELRGGEPVKKRLKRNRCDRRSRGPMRPSRGASQRSARGQYPRRLIDHPRRHAELHLDESPGRLFLRVIFLAR